MHEEDDSFYEPYYADEFVVTYIDRNNNGKRTIIDDVRWYSLAELQRLLFDKNIKMDRETRDTFRRQLYALKELIFFSPESKGKWKERVDSVPDESRLLTPAQQVAAEKRYLLRIEELLLDHDSVQLPDGKLASPMSSDKRIQEAQEQLRREALRLCSEEVHDIKTGERHVKVDATLRLLRTSYGSEDDPFDLLDPARPPTKTIDLSPPLLERNPKSKNIFDLLNSVISAGQRKKNDRCTRQEPEKSR